jgi:hypothetical protein
VNDTAPRGFYAAAMTVTTTKEQTMKTQITHKLAPLAAVLGLAATLAAGAGQMGWSDANLKQEIHSIDGALAKLRSLS